MNNKGFAISTLLYGLSILGLLLIVLLMSTVTSNRINTRGLVKEIEEDLNRYSAIQSSITSTSPEQAKQYTVSEGHGGWYKIELWSSISGTNVYGDYKAKTIYLPENLTVYFYIGNTTKKDTLACLDSDGSRDKCNTNNIIETTATGANFSNTNVSQIFYTVDENNEAKPNTLTVNNQTRYNTIFLEKTNAGVGRARITLVSQEKTMSNSKDPTAVKGNYYIIAKDKTTSDGKWVALTSPDKEDEAVSAKTFTGSKNQTWTISDSPSHAKDIAGEKYYSIVNVGNGRALASTTEAGYGHYLYTNSKYVQNNDYRSQDWLITKLGEDNFNLYPFEKTTSLDDILTSNCGRTQTNSRFCIGKKAYHDTANSKCVEAEKFEGQITLNFNCWSIRFINAEM